jgi:hypothetical protein
MLRHPRNVLLVTVALAGAFALFLGTVFLPATNIATIAIADGVGAALMMVALVAWNVRREVEISVSRQCIVLRRGLGSLCRQRLIGFNRIRAIRLVQVERHGRHWSRILFVADSEDLDCPTTVSPRQQALLLAMTLNVRLIKIWQSTTPTAPEDRIHQLSGMTQEQ